MIDEKHARAALAALADHSALDDVLRAVQRGLLDGDDLEVARDVARDLMQTASRIQREAYASSSRPSWFGGALGHVHLARWHRHHGDLFPVAACSRRYTLDWLRPEAGDVWRCIQCSRLAAEAHIASGGPVPSIVPLLGSDGESVGWSTRWGDEPPLEWLFVDDASSVAYAGIRIPTSEMVADLGGLDTVHVRKELMKRSVLVEETARRIRRREI